MKNLKHAIFMILVSIILLNLSISTCRRNKKLKGDITWKEKKFTRLKAEIPEVISANQELYDSVKKLEPKLNRLVSFNRKYAIKAYHKKMNEFNKKLGEAKELFNAKSFKELNEKIHSYSHYCSSMATSIEHFVGWCKSWRSNHYFGEEFKDWIQEMKDEENKPKEKI